MGHISPSLAQKYQINDSVFMAQISLTAIFDYLNIYPPLLHYQPVSNFPFSSKDLSFIFPENIDYSQIIKEIKKTADKNLQSVNVFDIYQNTELAQEKKKSVSFRLVFQSSDRTLKNKEIEKILKDIGKRVEKVFAAKLRD